VWILRPHYQFSQSEMKRKCEDGKQEEEGSTYRACSPKSVAWLRRSSALAFEARAKEPCIVCSRMRIEDSSTCRCRVRTLYAVFASERRAEASCCGRSCVAMVCRSCAAVGREDVDGGAVYHAILVSN
jgi:hypothetical protein